MYSHPRLAINLASAARLWYFGSVIAQLKGTLLDIDSALDAAVVDVGGVGFRVLISLTTLQALPPPGQPVKLLTYLLVREDALILYGFATVEERRAFELCLSVSGVGPKMALAALSGLGPAALGDAIAKGDVERLTRLPGIGKKTAERLVVELRDKFRRSTDPRTPGPAAGRTAAKSGSASATGILFDVISALCNLGYKPLDAERAATQALEKLPEAADAELPSGEQLREVLRLALRALKKD